MEGNLHIAGEWLCENGFDIVHRSRSAQFAVYWDKEVLQEKLVAHFIVRKAGKFYAVIVRNQEESSFNKEQVYSQWFPIFNAFAVHGVLELNIHTEHIRFINFEIASPRFVYWRRVMQRSIWFLSGVMCAIMVMYKQ